MGGIPSQRASNVEIMSISGGLHVWLEIPVLLYVLIIPWWRHQMEIFSALLAICAGNSPVPGEFPAQRTLARGFYVFFDLRPNKWLSKQSWGWWFEMPSRPFWRHCNDALLGGAEMTAYFVRLLCYQVIWLCVLKENCSHARKWILEPMPLLSESLDNIDHKE